ncbi:TPA: hypothetical protein R2K48_004398 [Raoultella ornithinolytica]|nr:hypothetical protein [Raoultella ornithinolytica]
MTSKISIDNRELLQKISTGEAAAGIDFGNAIVRELAAFRLAAMDSEPVAVPDHLTYLQNPTLENVLSDAEENSPMSHAARILAREVKFWRSAPLYRHAQPAPVVPDIDELRLAFEAAERESDDGFNLHKYGIGYADDETQGRWDTWLACRAAMLQAGNSPVIPDGYVMVPKEPTPEILAVISEAIRAMRGSAATYARVLAAAPQEVPDGQR